ncbi:MAG: hypothetical protein WBI57_06310, partial [Desulfobacterales bacterium]
IDLITSISGMDFQEIWKNRSVGKFGRQQVFFIGMNDLIATKKIANRSQDKADLELLERVDKKD